MSIPNISSEYQVVIAGGGPVGLFLGACLQKFNISYLILEKRAEIRSGSRSIGIHPVSLERFEKLNLADELIQKGVKISKGHAFSNTSKIGSLSFKSCPEPYKFILSLPQALTEQILEDRLKKSGRNILVKDAEVTDFVRGEDHIYTSFNFENKTRTIKSRFLVGCDGKESIVRQKANIDFSGRYYPDNYIMGDFRDNTHFGSEAAVFLCKQGLIESFPLPDKKRRWVVKTDSYHQTAGRSLIERKIKNRTDHSLSEAENTMLSSFRTQKFVANTLVKDRVILAGDAAHIVSPIGGQGMNLGWLAAHDLAKSLKRIIYEGGENQRILKKFEKRRIKAAKASIRRAELNMRLGRKSHFPFVRNAIVSVMLNTPLSNMMARTFTMRGIENQ